VHFLMSVPCARDKLCLTNCAAGQCTEKMYNDASGMCMYVFSLIAAIQKDVRRGSNLKF
jgi:hypothetical protein